MKRIPVTFEVDDAMYSALQAVAASHGRSIEDYWSERLEARFRELVDGQEVSHGE